VDVNGDAGMRPENVNWWKGTLLAIILFELVILILFVVSEAFWQTMTPDPEVIEYIRTCGNHCEVYT